MNNKADQDAMLEYPHVESAVRKLPHPVIAGMQKFPYKAVVAGGFLRAISCGNNPVSDIDVFVVAPDSAEKVVTILGFLAAMQEERWTKRDQKWVVTKNAVTTVVEERVVQVIRGFPFSSPGAILRSFDLTISKAAVWMQGEANGSQRADGLCAQSFLRDVCQRRLRYMSDGASGIDTINTAKRICKFIRQGFTLSPEDLVEFMAVSWIDFGSKKNVSDMISSLETAKLDDYGNPVVSLRPVGTDKLTDGDDKDVKSFRDLAGVEKELFSCPSQ